MFELTIGNQVYTFRFGLGFMREMDPRVKETKNGVTKNIGLRLAIAGIIDGEIETLIDVLDVANKGQDLRLTRRALEDYIEDEETDIDKLFEDVLGFLKTANCTRRVTNDMLEQIEMYKENQKNQS